MTKQVELIAFLFDGQAHMLSDELTEWMEESPRFTDFADIYRDKIRKKIRVASQPEGILDLRGELDVACRLLSDRRLEVKCEPYASMKKRGADFAVSYRKNLVFNIEVARIRENKTTGFDLMRKEERILHILLEKLGQMRAKMANLLVIQMQEEIARAIDLEKLMQSVKTRAETRDDSFYTHSRYESPADFYRDFLRLSGILLWVPEAQLWLNKQSKPRLDEKILRLVSSMVGGAP